MDYSVLIRFCYIGIMIIAAILLIKSIKANINNLKERKLIKKKNYILNFIKYIILYVLAKFGLNINNKSKFTYCGDISILSQTTIFYNILSYKVFSFYLKYEKEDNKNANFIIYFFDPGDNINFNDIESVVKNNLFFVVTENNNISLYINKIDNSDIFIYNKKIDTLYEYIDKIINQYIIIEDHTNI